VLRMFWKESELYFPLWCEDLTRKLKGFCEKFGYNLTVPRAYSVPYEKMHLLPNEFDIFVDRFSIKGYSKTSREAMSCGLPVIGYKHDLEKALKELTSHRERKNLVEWQNRRYHLSMELKQLLIS